MIICKKCLHYRAILNSQCREYCYRNCKNVIDAITGEQFSEGIKFSCQFDRQKHWNKKKYCGPDGQFFEPIKNEPSSFSKLQKIFIDEMGLTEEETEELVKRIMTIISPI